MAVTVRSAARTLRKKGYDGPAVVIKDPDKYLNSFRKKVWVDKAKRLFNAEHAITGSLAEWDKQIYTIVSAGNGKGKRVLELPYSSIHTDYIRLVRDRKPIRHMYLEQVPDRDSPISGATKFVPHTERNAKWLEAFERIINSPSQ